MLSERNLTQKEGHIVSTFVYMLAVSRVEKSIQTDVDWWLPGPGGKGIRD